MTASSPAGRVVVAGIVNIETTARVERFPFEYAKSRFQFHGVTDRLGGVGYNVAAACAGLGVPVALLATLGRDVMADVVAARLASIPGLSTAGVVAAHPATLRSVILVEETGGRGAMITDLKDSQELVFPPDVADRVLEGAAILHASNINWAHAVALRARGRGVTVSTDVQAIAALDEPYNVRFIQAADIIFFSGENLRLPAREAVDRLLGETSARVVVCSLAGEGALLGRRGEPLLHQPAPNLRPVLNPTGAGDAMAAGFVTAWAVGRPAEECLLRGQIAAGWKIGAPSGEPGIIPPEVWERETAARCAN